MVTLATGLAACSDDEPEPGTGTTAGDPTAELALACTEVINARDYDVSIAGRDASYDLVLATASESAGAPDTDRRDGWRSDMAAARDRLRDDQQKLAELSDDPDWAELMEPLEDQIATYDARIAALDEGVWPPTGDIRMGGPDADEADEESDGGSGDTESGESSPAARLGLLTRDCDNLLEPGPLSGSEEFVRDAATTCAQIVDRRRVEDYADAQEVAIAAVVARVEDRDVEVTDELVDAVDQIHDEWQQTLADLQQVEVGDVPDQAGWEENLQLAQDRVDLFDGRLEALRGGDQAAIADAYDPARLGVPGWTWDEVALGGRDCRAVQA